mgnify:CR=1 FL=1
MASLAEIRAKLLEQEKGGNTRSNSYGGDNAIYAFWNIPEGQSATMRFLPDGDDTNTYFWRERQMIRIPFSGVAGGDEHKPVAKQECHILLVEPRGVTNTGQTSSNLTAENDIWI